MSLHGVKCHCPVCVGQMSGNFQLKNPYPPFVPKADPLQESLAAIRDAITSRDRHFDALAEQIRLGFEAVQRQTEEDRGAVQGQIAVLGAQLEQIKVKQESTNFINTSINNILARRLPEKQQPAGRKKAKR